MYHRYSKQSHDAFEKSRKCICNSDDIVMAPTSYDALGYDGTNRFGFNLIHLIDSLGIPIWFPSSEDRLLKEKQAAGDLRAQQSRVMSMRWYKDHQAEFFQDDDCSTIEDGSVLTFVDKKRKEGHRVLVITQSEELARTLIAWNSDDTLPPVTVKQISRYGYLRNLQAYYDYVNEQKSQVTQNELDELASFEPLVTS